MLSDLAKLPSTGNNLLSLIIISLSRNEHITGLQMPSPSKGRSHIGTPVFTQSRLMTTMHWRISTVIDKWRRKISDRTKATSHAVVA